MNRIAILTAAALVGFSAPPLFAQQAGTPDTVKGVYGNAPLPLQPFSGMVKQPYRRFFLTPMTYPGPGRNKPDPVVDTVKIGVLAPLERSDETYIGVPMLNGVRLAVKEANEAGGWHGKPFSIVVRNDTGLWGASANEIVGFSYQDSVWGVIGSVDGANTHIAIRVALKTEIPIVNAADTDPTLVETAIPWIFRVIADDRQMSYTLANHLYRDCGYHRVAILRANNRYGRFGVSEFRYASVRLGNPAPIEVNYDLNWAEIDTTFAAQVDRLQTVAPDAIVLWADAQPAGYLVRAIRAAGMTVPIFACDRIINPAFARIAGPAAAGVVACSPFDPSRNDPILRSFEHRYRAEFGVAPTTYSATGFDAAQMLITAIQEAGLNRYRIRDRLAAMKRYHGVTGQIVMDDTYSNREPTTVATYYDGSWHFGVPHVSHRY